MATVPRDFKVKNGLIVEGTTGTIDNYDILTKSPDSIDYIIDQVGGSGTSLNTPNTLVLRDGSGNFAAGTITANLTGNVTGTVSDISNHDTDDLTEGTTNKYFSDALARGAFSGGTGLDYDSNTGTFDIDSTVVTETGNFTLTNKTISGSNNTLSDIGNGSLTNSSITINGATISLGGSDTLDTDDINEGATNKYFSDTLARGAVSAGDGLNYNSSTGEFSSHLGNGLTISGGAIAIDDTIVATETDLSGAISAHNASSGIHGVTGDVVGTTDTQTISNKTLGSDLDADGYKITNLATPTQGGDAVNKSYIDGLTSGLSWKEAVNLLYDAAIPVLSGSGASQLIIDGHAPLGDSDSGYRVLITQSSDAGIYVYNSTGGNWTLTRAADADTFEELVGAAVFVMEGDNYASTSWVQSNHYLSSFTNQTWSQFSGAGTYLAGNGLELNGNTFEIDTTVTATRTYVDTELDAHIDLTANVHGVTGSVVGTSDTQTLTNKTLGSGTLLSANIDAANTYTIANLEDPTNNQDAATKYYVDTEVSDVAGDLTTHQNATTGIHGVTGNIVGTSDSQTLTNKTIDGSSNTISNIANASLVNDSVTINGNSLDLGGSLTLDTDDISEGTTNKYFTENRAKDAAGYILENASLTNIQITYDENAHTLSITAENGVADSTTNNLAEGTDNSVNGGNNLYFTNARAVAALEAVVPNFTEIDVNDIATQVAATTSVVTASTVTAYDFAHATYRSGKFLVKAETSSHTQVSEVLVTLDSTNNVAVTEYAIVGTNGNLFDVTADVSGADVRIRVETLNNNTDVTVVGTLIK